jgi:hypothetical protein
MPTTRPRASNNGPPDRRNDAYGQRIGLPEGTADRGDRLPDDDPRGVAERHRLKWMLLRIELQNANVVVDVVSGDGRGDAVPIGELDVDGCCGLDRTSADACGRDHVGVRQDHSSLRDDEAGALCSAGVGADA